MVLKGWMLTMAPGLLTPIIFMMQGSGQELTMVLNTSDDKVLTQRLASILARECLRGIYLFLSCFAYMPPLPENSVIMETRGLMATLGS